MPGDLLPIEGGRSIHARTTLARFAATADAIQFEIEMPAGFMIVLWDDEGQAVSALYKSERCPYAEQMLRDVIVQAFNRSVRNE